MYLDHQAAQTLASHLRARGYAAIADQHLCTITLRRRQETVTVGQGYGPKQVCSEDLRSSSPETVQKALDWVRKIVRLRGRPKSVYRSVETRRNSLDNDFDDILFRSKTLSRCPNPSDAELRQYAPLVRRVAKHVWNRFRRQMLAFGYEAEDLETYGMVHLTTALHRYRTGNQARDEAIIGRYVTQRLMEVVRKVKRKAMQCSADSEVRSWSELRD
jgi:hypothetical protein